MERATIRVADVNVELISNGDSQVLIIDRGEAYESESRELWASVVQPGKMVIDVGAYTGLYSVIAAKLGASVVAIEPMPDNRKRLIANLKMNNVQENVRVVAGAASDVTTIMEFGYNRNTPFLTAGGSLEQLPMHTDSFEVEVFQIDDLNLRDVVAIKIDVEKHELSVIRGAAKTIDRWRPVMLVETLDEGFKEQVLDLLPNYRIDRAMDTRNTLFVPDGW